MPGETAANEHPFPPTLNVIPTIYPTSAPVDEQVDDFWSTGPEFHEVRIDARPPNEPLEILEQLGPSPFPRGRFPLIGFLATTYDRVGRYALKLAGKEADFDN